MKLFNPVYKVSILLATSLLVGCGTTPLLNDQNKPALANGEGVVFTSFTRYKDDDFRGESYANTTSVTLVIKRIADGKMDYRLSTAGIHLIEKDGVVTTRQGYPRTPVQSQKLSILSAITLPAGDYEIISRNSQLIMYPFEYRNERPLKPTQKITVKANELLYIDSTHITFNNGKNILGMTAPGEIDYRNQDSFDADYADLLKVRSDWKALKVTKASGN